jgi:hypothetical protein
LQQALRIKDFDPKWCSWIQNYIEKGSVGIRVNNDPLSPILFNIVADMLAIMIARAKEEGQVAGVIQYVDDTILLMEHDLDKALNTKLVLCIFNNCLVLK